MANSKTRQVQIDALQEVYNSGKAFNQTQIIYALIKNRGTINTRQIHNQSQIPALSTINARINSLRRLGVITVAPEDKQIEEDTVSYIAVEGSENQYKEALKFEREKFYYKLKGVLNERLTGSYAGLEVAIMDALEFMEASGEFNINKVNK